MKKISKIFILVISAALIVSFFVPVWYIDLEAPQYPEGLGLKIWHNKMSGDLATINNINHYIGMKSIIPDSIPELKIIPFILIFLILGGIVVAVSGKRWALGVWVVIFIALGIIGGIDFYLWGYDYGHNLDPRAAIKVPGMSYQPPLLGSKQLLNFKAHSYPDVAGWVIILGGFISIIFFIYEMSFSRFFHHKNL